MLKHIITYIFIPKDCRKITLSFHRTFKVIFRLPVDFGLWFCVKSMSDSCGVGNGVLGCGIGNSVLGCGIENSVLGCGIGNGVLGCCIGNGVLGCGMGNGVLGCGTMSCFLCVNL